MLEETLLILFSHLVLALTVFVLMSCMCLTMSVYFLTYLSKVTLSDKQVKCSCMVNHLSATRFSFVFSSGVFLFDHDNTDIDYVDSSFNSHCSTILDQVAPLRTRIVPSVNSSPWLNDDIRFLRRNCWRVDAC